MKRRHFVLGVAISAATSPGMLAAQQSAPMSMRARLSIKRHGLESLSAYVDTLLPTDETLGAAALGVHGHLIEHAASIENYLKLLSLGCAWLDRQARPRKRFSHLPEPSRARVVKRAQSSTPGKIERLFFERTHDDLLGLYYANPKAWHGLGFAGPPQPFGFLDFDRPPA